MDKLGLYPQLSRVAGPSFNSTSLSVNATNITLHEFENALASMTALLYWAGTNVFSSYHRFSKLIQYHKWAI
jgi:hypothetical protein